jgi:hypothetical protein
MVLSDTGVSDTQLVILSAASQREDGAVLPLTIDLKGGAVQKVLASLERNELIARMGKPRGDDPPPLCITRPGLDALGIAPEDPEAPDPALGAPPFVEVTEAPQRGTKAPEPAPANPQTGASETAPAAKRRAPRENTQAGADDRAA